MDKEKGIGFLFKTIGIFVFIISIYVLYYLIINPHHFFVLNEGNYTDNSEYCLDDNLEEEYNFGIISKTYCNNQTYPVLECKDISKFKYNNYKNVIGIKIFHKQCYMYNLPNKDPYVKESNKFVYFIVKNEVLIFLIYILIFILFDLYRYKYKNKSYIKKLYHLFKDRGDK